MKIIVLILIVLGISGCFDGDRGVLTELLIQPAPPAPVQPGLPTKIAAGTGSELVVSPIPERVEEQLFGSWDEAVDQLEGMLKRPNVQPGGVNTFCDIDVHRRVFYHKYIDAGGIAIIGPSNRTSRNGIADEWLYAAREVILTMTSARPGLREVLSLGHEMGFRYVLMGANIWADVSIPSELNLNVGSGFFRPLRGRALAFGGVYFYYHGLGNSEEFFNVGTVAHEMAHAIDYAFDHYPHLFPDWGTRLTAAYEAAKVKAARGESYFPAGDYAMVNEMEYWASGASEWFTNLHGGDSPRIADEIFRQQMLRSDPLLYGLLDEVFPAVDFPKSITIEAED